MGSGKSLRMIDSSSTMYLANLLEKICMLIWHGLSGLSVRGSKYLFLLEIRFCRSVYIDLIVMIWFVIKGDGLIPGLIRWFISDLKVSVAKTDVSTVCKNIGTCVSW